MIIYHPANDVNHCSYRILNILYATNNNKLHCDMLKIVNFYYVYPHLLKRMKSFPRPLNYQAKKISNIIGESIDAMLTNISCAFSSD